METVGRKEHYSNQKHSLQASGIHFRFERKKRPKDYRVTSSHMTAVCEASVGLFSLGAHWNHRWNDPGERKLKQGLFSEETSTLQRGMKHTKKDGGNYS